MLVHVLVTVAHGTGTSAFMGAAAWDTGGRHCGVEPGTWSAFRFPGGCVVAGVALTCISLVTEGAEPFQELVRHSALCSSKTFLQLQRLHTPVASSSPDKWEV